jgi:hypothetical protein
MFANIVFIFQSWVESALILPPIQRCEPILFRIITVQKTARIFDLARRALCLTSDQPDQESGTVRFNFN